jgi:hypothetical protein
LKVAAFFRLVLPPFAGAFCFDAGPDFQEYRFEFGELVGVFFGEVVHFLPVGFDLVKLEFLKVLIGDNFPIADAHCGLAFGGGDVGAPEEWHGTRDGLARARRENIDPIDGAVGGQRNTG